MNVIAVVLIAAGVFFMAVSAIGLLRFDDFYTRAHVVAKSETFGIILVISGVIIQQGFASGSPRLLLLIGLAAIANPTAVHALARAYHQEVDPSYPRDPEGADLQFAGEHDAEGDADDPGVEPGDDDPARGDVR